MIIQAPQLVGTDTEGCHKTDEEHQRPQEAEHMHRFLTKGTQEPERQQVQITVHKTIQTHEFRRAIFTGLMLNNLLTNLVEAGIFGQIRYITVHLAIDLNVFHHGLTIGLQTTIEVVQVLDTAHLTGRRIKELRGERLGDGVITLLLITTHQVVAFHLDHTIQLWNLVGRVLKVGIHRDHHITLCLLKTAIERRTLTVVTTELDTFHHIRLLGMQLTDNIPRTVG